MMDIGKDLVKAYEEGMRDARAKIDNEVFELQTEVKRLERICHSYALQYGTVTDQQKVIDKAKSDVAREIFEEIENWFELYSEREYSFAEEETAKEHYPEAEAHDYALDIIKDLRQLCIAELKKKYTEGESNGSKQ